MLLLLGAVGTLCQWSTLTLAQVPAYMPPVATLRPGPRYDLAGRQPRYYQEEAVNLFFASAKTIRQEKGRPMRLQLAGGTGKTAIYTMIAQRALRNKPLARIVIFVPWKALAEQTHQKLTECGLKTCIVGDGFARVDRSASVVVCVFNSACRLRGQGFAVKLIDEAHHTEGEGFFTNIMRHQIRADLEGDFSATFRASEVDYSYGFDKAVKDGYLCDMQSFILPLVARCKEEEYAKLVKIVTERKAEWSPMLILFNRIENAKAFSDILNAHDVPSAVVSHRDGRNLRQYHRQAFEDGELKVLCTVKVFNEGTDLPMLRSVIMAEPRPTSDIGVVQAAMRALRPHGSKPDNKACVVQVVNPGVDSTDHYVKKVVRGSLRQITGVWRGIGSAMQYGDPSELVEKEPNSVTRLHLMDTHGKPVKAADAELWQLLESQGRQRWRSIRKWLWELVAWWRYFGDKPRDSDGRNVPEARETQQVARWRRARRLVQEGAFTAAEVDMLQTVGMLEELEKEYEQLEILQSVQVTDSK